MKHLYEFLLSKDNAKDVTNAPLDKDETGDAALEYLGEKFCNKFDIRKLRTGNVELILKNIEYKVPGGLHTCDRLKFTLYVNSKPMTIRRAYGYTNALKHTEEWQSPASKMKDYNSIEELCDDFKNWISKHGY